MVVEYNYLWQDKAYRRALRKAPDELAVELKGAFTRAIHEHMATMTKKNLRGRTSGNKGLFRRTGALADSQKVVVRGKRIRDLEAIYAIGGGGVRYAWIHEVGGTIKPKRSQFLVFRPQEPDLGDGSNPRRSLRAFSAKTAEEGPLVFARRVVIPPRLRERVTFRAGFQRRLTMFRAAVQDALHKAVRKGKQGPP